MREVILYETPKQTHYVTNVGHKGFAVWRNGAVAATLVASIGHLGAAGLARAIAEADKREGAH